MRLVTAEIDRYGPLAGCRPTCADGITVVAGPNESGKTLYLEGLLQLVDSGVTTYMRPGPRVDGRPIGRVVLDDGTDHHTLGDGVALSDVSRIEPNHLYNLFVIRDSDLTLPEGSAYYTTLVEHLGDVHTSAIDRIRERLVERGRLTPKTLGLANREFGTKDCRMGAETLATDIERYLETAADEGIEDTVRARLRTRREFASVSSRLETQRTAEALAEVADAREHLRAYADACERIEELATFDRGTLDQLRELAAEHARSAERVDDLSETLDRERAEVERLRDELRADRERHTELRMREADVEAAETALESYRSRTSDGDGIESRLALRRHVAVAGVLGAGIAAGGGVVSGSTLAIGSGIGLLLVSIGAWLSHRRLAGRLDAAAARERTLLRTTRDAGFDVETPADVAPLLREYRTTLAGVESRIHDLEARVSHGTDRVEELASTLDEENARRDANFEEVTATVEAADVGSIEEFGERVEEREAAERRRSEAAAILEREFGASDAETPAARIECWEAELSARETAVGATDVTAAAYDHEELDRLRTRETEIGTRLDELDDELDAYRESLDEFDRRANELTPPPFVEVDPSLDARTTEGLRELAADLRELVAAIDRNAELSRKAIEVFDTIRADEERKVSALFDPDGPASQALTRLTEGRYAAIEYDPDGATLSVTTAHGETRSANELSRATRDQLYFAARLSLARKLLGGDAGFLLLDDPFLAADRSRLRHGFETLTDLAADGWQIVYLTAKEEVYDGMAVEFNCEVYELAQLEV